MEARNQALVNGALMAIGALGVVDNVLVHWLLGLHRAVPGEHALAIEILLVIASMLLFALGFARELRARQRPA